MQTPQSHTLASKPKRVFRLGDKILNSKLVTLHEAVRSSPMSYLNPKSPKMAMRLSRAPHLQGRFAGSRAKLGVEGAGSVEFRIYRLAV